MKKLFFTFAFVSFCTWGAQPTIEGLLRNPHNKDLSGGVIVVKMMVNTIEEEISSELTDGQQVVQKKPRFYKLIFSVEEGEQSKLLQVEYSDGKMRREDLLGMAFLPDLETTISEEKNIEKALIYSWLVTLSLNRSTVMNKFLERYADSYQTNMDLLNKEKVELLNNYKRFLIAHDANKELEPGVVSPLKPTDSLQKEEVDKLLKARTYQQSNNIKLTRVNKEFFWRASFNNLTMDFTNDEHQLRLIRMNLSSGDIELDHGDYIVFDGVHELPKVTTLKTVNGQKFHIQMLDLDHLPNHRKIEMSYRAKTYQDNISEVVTSFSKETSLIDKPSFLY